MCPQPWEWGEGGLGPIETVVINTLDDTLLRELGEIRLRNSGGETCHI